MKNKGLKSLLVVLFVGLFTINSNAQPINLGGGIVLGTDRPNFGLRVQGTYGMDFLLNNLSASAGFTFFIPASPGNTTYNRWAIDLDGQYTFFEASGFNFYAIGGLNIAHYNAKTTVTVFGVTNSSTVSGTKPGLNVGAGLNYSFSSNMKAFSEFKYILSNYDQAEISVGVLFEL